MLRVVEMEITIYNTFEDVKLVKDGENQLVRC